MRVVSTTLLRVSCAAVAASAAFDVLVTALDDASPLVVTVALDALPALVSRAEAMDCDTSVQSVRRWVTPLLCFSLSGSCTEAMQARRAPCSVIVPGVACFLVWCDVV